MRINLIAAACLFGFSAAAGAKTDKPNFVFFLVDDLGWADVGCFGSTFHETPNIDGLAASGMKFTNAYAAASICSPTRASIMTGRHPARVNITDWIPGARAPKGGKFKHLDDLAQLPLEEITIAEALKENGYATFFAGKWHLGSEGFLPTDQGFDFNIGGHHRGSPPGGYYSPWSNPHLKAEGKEEYLTERLTKESIEFMEGRNADEPFLLYLSYYNVHTPIQPYKKRIEHYKTKAEKLFPDPTPTADERGGVSRMRQDNPEFASMVAAVDDSVGAILASLEELKIADNTVVIFFSDNGGLCTKGRAGPTSNLPLRAGKGWLYEGGIREPTIVRAPGLTKAGGVCDSPVVSMDFFPTMLELAGLEMKPDVHADGMSIVQLLRGEKADTRELVWHYPHYHGSTWAPGAAIRVGEWKLIEFWEYDEVELYNLSDDPGEQKDLSAEQPERVQQLLKQAAAWRTRIQAKMPELNPAAGN
ncbi:MAG: arylsulfatase A-like enzyme [Verrucomicrobiales bacterium]|jgi:arylsulfatase A-like enzyme